MEDAAVRKFKIFGAWQDDKEEIWLREMALKGLHLSHPLVPCFYTFVRGQAGDVAYRLDYLPRRSPQAYSEYLQVFRDAGWEHVGEMAGWQYFRKPVQDAGAHEIYTDVESKVQKYRRLFGVLVIFLPLVVMIPLTSFERYATSCLGRGIIGFQLGATLLITYGLARIAMRIRQLRTL